MEALKVEYDNQGRIKYTPAFHSKHKTPWTFEDLKYLIDWYDFIGPEEMSFALERPETAINQKVTELRRKGIMPQPKYIRHKKLKSEAREARREKYVNFEREEKKSCANSSTR